MPALHIPSVLFVAAIAALILILWRMHTAADAFDMRDIICEIVDGKRVVSTSKSLLTGAFLFSTYYLIINPGGTEFAAYLAAWVVNGGVVAWRKTKMEEAQKP